MPEQNWGIGKLYGGQMYCKNWKCCKRRYRRPQI